MTAFRFTSPAEVRYADLDPQGHLNNAKHLSIWEQARLDYWVQLGLFSRGQSFMDIGIILADTHIRYLAPVHWGHPISVGVATTKIGNKSFTMEQAILSADGSVTYSDGEMVMVAYDYRRGVSIPVPQGWREKLEAFEGHALSA